MAETNLYLEQIQLGENIYNLHDISTPTYEGVSPITITPDASVSNQYNIGFDNTVTNFLSKTTDNYVKTIGSKTGDITLDSGHSSGGWDVNFSIDNSGKILGSVDHPIIPQGTVTSVRVQATAPVLSSLSTSQSASLDTIISLADAYGDTKNPYGSKTAKYVLAAPTNTNGVPSFRQLSLNDLSDGANAIRYVGTTTETMTEGQTTDPTVSGVSSFQTGDLVIDATGVEYVLIINNDPAANTHHWNAMGGSPSDIAKGVTAYGWGNHAEAGYVTENTATVKIIDSSNKRVGSSETSSKYIGFTGGLNKFTVSDNSGSTSFDVPITPYIANNVTYSGTLTDGRFPIFDGTTGVIKKSGYGPTSYVKYNDVIQPTNPFGGKKLYINSIDNAFTSADKKFWVTVTRHNQVVDGVTYPHVKEGAVIADNDYWVDSPAILTYNADAIHYLFNGIYEDTCTATPGTYLKVHIQFSQSATWKPSTGTAFTGYPYGNYYLSFYYNNTPGKLSQLRVYNRYAAHTVGWKLLTATAFTGSRTSASYIEKISDDANYQRSCLEFIIYGRDDSTNTGLSQIEYQLTRPSLPRDGSTVTKYGVQLLYWDFEWYRHNNSGAHTKVIWTSIGDGTIGLDGLTPGNIIKANANKKLVSASLTTKTVPTSISVGTATGISEITPTTNTVVTSIGSASSSNFVQSYSPSTSNFVTGYTPSSAIVVTSVSVKGAVTSVTPTTSKLTTTTITAVGGTVTASQATAGTEKTLLTSIAPQTSTIVGVSGTVTASKATSSTALTATVVSSVTPITAITTATYASATCMLTFGSSAINSVTTQTLSVPQYTFSDVNVPVADSSKTIVTGFGTNGTTTITPYSFTTVTAATPASSGIVVATGGLSTASSGATVVTAVSSTGTDNNLTVTSNTTSVLAGLGSPSTAAAITTLGTPTTAAAITALGTVNTAQGIVSLGTVETTTIVTSVTTATTTINNWS